MKTKALIYILFLLNVTSSLLWAEEFCNQEAITLQKYCEFLNETASHDEFHLYDEKMAVDLRMSYIVRSGAPGSFCYKAGDWRLEAGASEKNATSLPVTFVSYNDVIQYCSWKNTNDAHSSSLQPLVSSLFVDQELKSNILIFCITSSGATASQASEMALGASTELDAIIEDLVGVMALGAAGAESVRSPEIGDMRPLEATREDTAQNSEKKIQPAVTLEGFQQALAEHCTATRFIIEKDKKSGKTSILPEFSGNRESTKNEKQTNYENENIKNELKKNFKTKYNAKEVDALFSGIDKYQVLDRTLLSELLKSATLLPSLDSKTVERQIDISAYQNLIENFQIRLQEAQAATKDVELSKSQIHEEDDQWHNDGIDYIDFHLALIRAAQARSQEILKVAKVRRQQCLEGKPNIKGPLDADLSGVGKIIMGYQSLETKIASANQAHEQFNEALKNKPLDVDESARVAREQWEKVIEHSEPIHNALQPIHAFFEKELALLQATYGYYTTHEKRLLTELSLLEITASAAWQKAFGAADDFLNVILEPGVMDHVKKIQDAFKNQEHAIMQVKQSFEEAKQAAATCLEDPKIYFFSEEGERSQALREMRSVWEKKIANYEMLVQEKEHWVDIAQRSEKLRNIFLKEEDVIQPLLTIQEIFENASDKITPDKIAEFEKSISSRSSEIEALRRSVAASKAVEEAEKKLTETTKMEWEPGQPAPQNIWASGSLQKDFIDKRESATKAEKNAIAVQEELLKKIVKIKNSYGIWGELFSEKIDAVTLLARCEKTVEQIKKAWREASQQAADKSQKAWKEALEAMCAARESKINWARNILRSAGRAVGNFSLGDATKKEGELLGKLWVGLEETIWKKSQALLTSAQHSDAMSDDEDSNQDGVESRDQLKRFRGLSYKPTYKAHQMNFERRLAADKRWQGKEPDGSIAWGNGHLTITNPHHNDVEENAMSVRFVALEPSQMSESFYSEKEMELKRAAEVVNQQALREQEELNTIENRIKVARYKNNQEEVDALSLKVAAIKEEQPKMWSRARNAYQKGLKLAPPEKQEWWAREIKRVEVQAKLDNADGTDELWEETLQLQKQAFASYHAEIKRCRQTEDFVPAEATELRDFWSQEIKGWQRKLKNQEPYEWYYQASKKTCCADALSNRFLTTMPQGLSMGEQAVKQLQKGIFLWDVTIKKFHELLENNKDASSSLISSWEGTIEAARDAKNQLQLKVLMCEALPFEVQRDRMMEDFENRPADQSFSEQLIHESEQALAVWNKASDLWQESYNAIPASRKDLCNWWSEQYSLIESHKSLAAVQILINKANRTSVVVNLADQKIGAALPPQRHSISLYDDLIQKNKEAIVAWNNAIKAMSDSFKKNNSLSIVEQQQQLEPLQAAQQCSLLSKLMFEAGKISYEGSVCTIVESCSSQRAKIIIKEAQEAWGIAFREIKKALQRAAASNLKLREWCEESLSSARNHYELCTTQLRALEQKSVEPSAQEKLRQAIQDKKNARK